MKNRTALLAVAAALVIGAILLLISRQSDQTPPESTPAPADPAALLDAIKDRGTLVVGTSADYPPFESRDDEGEIVGFDIDLIREIGEQMGVKVELKDIAFDGLSAALAVGQIDVAIAAISATPDRAALADFSTAYYSSTDAEVAVAGSDIAIKAPADLAAYRVGVQEGSVYEKWIEETLVEPGLMPTRNVFRFVDVGTGAEELAEGRIDIGIVDAPVAQQAEAGGKVAIVGQGFNSQWYSVAVPKGAQTLLDEVDGAISKARSNGSLNDLADKYFGSDESVPGEGDSAPPSDGTGSPQAPPCLDAMAWVADVSYDDNSGTTPPKLPPGQSFTKTWSVRNAGTCTWSPQYQLVYVDGNVPAARMGGVPSPIGIQVAPELTANVSVNLVAPLVDGVYQGFWQMTNAQGQAFGERLRVMIAVTAVTPTAAPTQPPVSNISFSVQPTTIDAGGCATLAWSATGASEVYVYEQGQPWETSGVAGSGERQVCPSTSTTYEMRVVGADGTVQTRQVSLTVNPVKNAPTIMRFTLNPPNDVALGACVRVEWVVDGTVDTVTLDRDGEVLWKSAPTTGAIDDCPTSAGVVGYGIVAEGPGGQAQSRKYVRVLQPPPGPTPVPAPTPTQAPPAPIPPVIDWFTAMPAQIAVGGCVQLSWSASGGATSVQLSRDGFVVLDQAPMASRTTDCLTSPGVVNYRLSAANEAGSQVTSDQEVTVAQAKPDNPLEGTSWDVTGLHDAAGALDPVVPGTTLTAQFEALGRLNGSGGCNSFGATYTVDTASLLISNITFSKRRCPSPEGIMEQEDMYFEALSTVTTFQVSGAKLTLSGPGGPLVELVAR